MNRHVKRIVDHVWGPIGSVILHIVIIILLFTVVEFATKEQQSEIEVMIIEPDATDLEEFEKELEQIQEQEMVEIDSPDVQIDAETPPDVNEFDNADPEVDFAALDVMNNMQSPLVMKGLLAGRSSSGRASSLKQYAGRWGEATEAAVIKALEWLKANQNRDGSWKAQGGAAKPEAMTGLGLLAFLSHGETTSSEQYGATVEKAIRYLTEKQQDNGGFVKLDSHTGPYEHAIATYAISEAYGLTRIPALKPVMEKAIQVIIDGSITYSNSAGKIQSSWNYEYSRSRKREDTSVTGWQVQALKAAYISGADNKNLKERLDEVVEYLMQVQADDGGFAYAIVDGTVWKGGPAPTGAAVLSLQLLGHGKSAQARDGMAALKGTSCDWIEGDVGTDWPLYAWYYVTQAKFHRGGQTWAGWNNTFARVYVQNQNEDGSWVFPGGREKAYGPVYGTVFSALTLQVYYRFLPTYSKIAVEDAEDVSEDDDVTIEII